MQKSNCLQNERSNEELEVQKLSEDMWLDQYRLKNRWIGTIKVTPFLFVPSCASNEFLSCILPLTKRY